MLDNAIIYYCGIESPISQLANQRLPAPWSRTAADPHVGALVTESLST
jgi:hypothetical protein